MFSSSSKIFSLSTLHLAACAGLLAACSSGGNAAAPGGNKGATDPGGNGNAGAAVDARFFLPTGDEANNTSAPTIETDAKGNMHSVYPAYVRGGAYYAFCEDGCAKQEDVKVVRFDTEGTVANAMIALDAQARPRILLSTFQRVYWLTCDAECTNAASWKKTELLNHGSDREVTGETLALDPQGRPRFLMHTYRAFLGVGQKTPETLYVQCDEDCHNPASWKQAHISNQIWQASHLRFDAKGRAHLATVATAAATETESSKDYAAYVRCDANCEKEDAWVGVGVGLSYRSEYDAVKIPPTISLALTKAGNPRILAMTTSAQNKKSITYFECDGDCTADNGKAWVGSVLSDHEKLDVGLDLALDASDHPRFAYTLNYMIIFGRCDDAKCALPDSAWKLTKIENGSDMPPDQIFLYPNCTVGAWFLHSPSIALTPSGMPRIGYQARDISGGVGRPDPNHGACKAGTDMTWSRVAMISKWE